MQKKMITLRFNLKNCDIGYKILYKNPEDDSNLVSLIEIDESKELDPENVAAVEKNTKPKSRYTEASLVKEDQKS